MKKTNSAFLLKTLFSCAVLTGAFLFLSVNSAHAQIASAHGNANPKAEIAQKLGVTAYPLGTFNREHVVSVLDQSLTSIRSAMHANPSAELEMKASYYTKVIYDIQFYNIAPEISLLTSLTEIQTDQLSGAAIPAKNLYNETIAQID